MSDYHVGYGKPPKSGKFAAGVSGNSKGRPKRKPNALGTIVEGVLNASVEYRESGRIVTATRREVRLMLLVERAIKGDLRAAELVLKRRAHALRHGEAGTEQLVITDWLPDYPGQSGQQKTKDFSARQVAAAVPPVRDDTVPGRPIGAGDGPPKA